MVQPTPTPLSVLYEADETAWLEATAALLRSSSVESIDTATLAEYLEDMARRDRREVTSRLAILIAHILKWDFQPTQRSRSWRTSMEIQRQELADLLESGVLMNHAHEVLERAYSNAVKQVVAETGLPAPTFPQACAYSLDELLTESDIAGEE